jgi:HEAT repeat protein
MSNVDIQAALESLRTGEESERRRAVEALGASARGEAIAPLLLALADESWPVRQAATDSLIAFDPALLLPALETALRDDENAALRNGAMEIYVRLGPAAGPPLIALLADADEEVRNFAAVMLGTLREGAAVGALLAALDDPDVNVRHSTATALGQIGSPEAVLPLMEALRSEPWLQYPAIHALGEIGDPRAAPALIGLLGDEFFRGPVLEALGRLGDRDVLPDVLPHLYDPEPAIRNAAVRAVVEIEQRVTARGESLDPQVQAALRREGLVDHLLTMLADDDPQNRRTAVITLGWLKEPRAERPLVDLLAEPALQEYVTHALVAIDFRDPEAYDHGLAHPVDTVRQGTVRCLAWIAPPGASERVAPLIHDPAPEVRAEAAAAIGRLDHEDAPMLLFELLSDESELIQESARDALARMAPERVRPMLVQALAAGDEAARVRAAETLGLLHDPAGAHALLAASRDPRESVRTAAIKALGEVEAPGVSDLLRAALGDESSLVRQQAALSLGALGEPESAADLLPLLEDQDPRMRFVALRALGRIRSAEAVSRVLPFLSDSRKELRFAAVESLGAIRAAAAVRPLFEVLRDPDRNLRRAAAESLGGIGDPQAVPSLMLALDDEHWSVRCAAATALGRVGSSKATPALLARLGDEDATVRRAAAAALGEIRDPRAVSRLAELVHDPALQATALEALRRSGPVALPEIERAFAGASPEVRRLLVDLAGKLEERAAGRLLLAALTDDAADVRAEAALVLGDGGFREAMRPLMDLKASDPSLEVRQAAARALRKLTPR